MRLRIRSRAALMAASVTVTTAIAPIVGGPDPCARDPTHSASSGLPVHTLSEVSAIAQTSPSRLSPRPLARGDDGDETVCDGPVLTLGTPPELSPELWRSKQSRARPTKRQFWIRVAYGPQNRIVTLPPRVERAPPSSRHAPAAEAAPR